VANGGWYWRSSVGIGGSKIPAVAGQEFLRTIFQEVEFPADCLGFAWFQAPDMKIGVDASDNSLEQFLNVVPGHGEQELAISGKASDEIMDRHIGRDGPRIHVGLVNAFRDINLSAMVAGFFGAPGSIQGGQTGFGKDETSSDVRFLVQAREGSNPDAGLCPLDILGLISQVPQRYLKMDLVLPGLNVVEHPHTRFKMILDLKPGGFRVNRN